MTSRAARTGSDSEAGVAGPLSTLPPRPAYLQSGGAQPRSQWQFPLLLHTP